MVDRLKALKTPWLTPAAVMLLLFGSLMLNNWAVVVVAAVLLVLGLLSYPQQRVRGGLAALIAMAIAVGLVVLLNSIR
ncbi:MAG: hypothetical protein AB7G21_06355 [Dehalococcoidia bacterium]